MGAPPPEKARAGRMNPAGISYLYSALEASTAIAETASPPLVDVVIAVYETAQPFAVLDLSELPARPSIFDDAQRHNLEGLLFLEKFVQEISQPVRKDGSEHIDYVPSQVI
ncbi:MAG: hypothetical protein JWQ21_2950 [Herminiimonas sp.]|nr:hypothetical protein [Herminiimonas sp.]